MSLISRARRLLGSVDSSAQRLAEISEGIRNQSSLINDKLGLVIDHLSVQNRLLQGPNPARPASSEKIDVWPVASLASPTINLDQSLDPVREVVDSAEFAASAAYFERSPSKTRSLLRPAEQALIYHVIRNLRPDHLIEVGTFRAGTTETMCRALAANGKGTLHTCDPFNVDTVPAIIGQWPKELKQHVKHYPVNSMEFFLQLARDNIRASLAFIDGNHDYEFAFFDVCAAARALRIGGFIFIDNISQPGPFWAARTFLSNNPDWRQLGGSFATADTTKAFDFDRWRIPGIDFMVLQAPRYLPISRIPWTFGQSRYDQHIVTGLLLRLVETCDAGTLHAQAVLRGFGRTQKEALAESSLPLTPRSGPVEIRFSRPVVLEGDYSHYTVEPWLIWEGDRPLKLAEAPLPLSDVAASSERRAE